MACRFYDASFGSFAPGISTGKVHEQEILCNGDGGPLDSLLGECGRSVNFGPIDLQAAEIFAIRNGKIHEIDALSYFLPYNAKTGWE